MPSSANENLSRADFALVLKAAAQTRVEPGADDSLPLAEAERIAAEAGIHPADFRAALASLRSAREGKGRPFGPGGVLSAEASIEGGISHDVAVHMLAQGQLTLSTAGEIEAPAAGLWRLSDRGSLLQVATLGDATTLSAASDRRRTKAGLIGGGTIVGAFGGVAAASAGALALLGSVEAMALAQIVGMAGGTAAGLAAGAAFWRATARRAHERVHAALERMRGITAPDPDGETRRLER